MNFHPHSGIISQVLVMILEAAVVLAVVAGIIILNPQERVKGGLRGGPIGPNESAYREEYQCFGVARDFCPPWPDYGCDKLCYGITYAKQCFIESNTPNGLQKTPSQCR